MNAVAARHVLAVLALAAAVRLPLLRLAGVWHDEATVGLMGLAILRGELPIYFFGQPFMGALGDAYLTAPAFFLLGPSARTLKLVAILLGLVWIGLVMRLAWDAFGPRTALFTGLVLALPPDYLLHWAHEGRPHYLLSMALGTLALLLALRVAVVGSRRMRFQMGLLGLVLGLAFWVNFLSVVFFPAVAVLALRRGLRWPLVGGGLVGVAGFALGSLPHWLYGLQHGGALPPAGGRIPLVELARHVRFFWRISWPMLTGVAAGLRDTAAGLLLALALAAAYAAALAIAARAVRLGPPAARAGSIALMVLAATNVGVAVGTNYGRFLSEDIRYLLPLYTALPVLLGHAFARLASWRAAAALVGALLLVQAVGVADGDYRPLLMPAARAHEDAVLQAEHGLIAALEQAGFTRLYAVDYSLRVFTFLSAERLIFSSQYEEVYPPYALAVDGAETAVWWTGPRWPLFEANLAALGVHFTYRLPGVYADFRLPGGGLRELDPARFVMTASDAASTTSWMVDRDAGTLWSTSAPKRGGEWVQVDLGVTEPVALVRWLPGTYQEVPNGLRLEASLDGQAWQRLIELPDYFGPLYWSAGHPMGRVRGGRVELRVPPTPARYLRITQLGKSALWRWTIRELFVYAATPGAPAAEAQADGPTLARAVQGSGVRRLYADHGWGARVALADPTIQTLPANLALDPYGDVGPAEMLWPRVHWTPGSGALLEPADAEGFTAAARAGGLGFTQTTVGGLVLFAYAPPPPTPSDAALPLSALTVTASRHPERAALAVDGDPRTRWATAHPQTAGDWVRVDFPMPRMVRALRLWTANPTDSPRGIALEGSADGAGWRPIAAEIHRAGPLRWGGIALLCDGTQTVRLDFAPVRLRALRLVLTAGDPVFDWSIHELTVYGAE